MALCIHRTSVVLPNIHDVILLFLHILNICFITCLTLFFSGMRLFLHPLFLHNSITTVPSKEQYFPMISSVHGFRSGVADSCLRHVWLPLLLVQYGHLEEDDVLCWICLILDRCWGQRSSNCT